MHMTRLRRHGREAAAVTAGVLLLGGVVLPGLAAGAEGDGFSAAAAATAVRYITKPSADPLGTVYDVTAPLASALVTSGLDSTAFAAAPYPGDDVIAQVNTVAGPQPYPFSVRSAVPGEPKASTSAPGYSLSAESTIASSRAVADAGASSAGDVLVGSSSASADVKGGTGGAVSALGTTATESFTAGPLSLSRVASRASAVLNDKGTVELTASMALGDVTVAGQKVGLTKDGLTVAGTNVPLPVGQLTDALKAAGVKVTVLAEDKTANAITAPGLMITYKDDQQDTTYVLGRAQASAAPSAAGPDLLPLDSAVPPFPEDTAAPVTAFPEAEPAFSLPVVPDGGEVSIGEEPALPSAAGPAPQAAGPSQGQQVAARSFVPQTFSSGLFYLVLVFAAGAALVLGQLMRYLGVRWASSS
jgi:hypothetical protein